MFYDYEITLGWLVYSYNPNERENNEPIVKFFNSNERILMHKFIDDETVNNRIINVTAGTFKKLEIKKPAD